MATKRTTSRTRRATASPVPTDPPSSSVAEPVEAAAPLSASQKVFGKRELIERVVLASGIKKKAAKPVVEAMLKELGEALSRGETLNLQPLGKGIVKTRKTLENAEVVEMRLRRSKKAMSDAGQSATKDVPLAEPAE